MFGLPTHSVTANCIPQIESKHAPNRCNYTNKRTHTHNIGLEDLVLFIWHLSSLCTIATIAKQSQKIKHKAIYRIIQNKTKQNTENYNNNQNVKELWLGIISSIHVCACVYIQLQCFPSLRTLYNYTYSTRSCTIFFCHMFTKLKNKYIIKCKMCTSITKPCAELAANEQCTFCSILL